jgi:hypothetical protein
MKANTSDLEKDWVGIIGLWRKFQIEENKQNMR